MDGIRPLLLILEFGRNVRSVLLLTYTGLTGTCDAVHARAGGRGGSIDAYMYGTV